MFSSGFKNGPESLLMDIRLRLISITLFTTLAGEFGIVYKGCLAGQYTDEVVAVKTLKGMVILFCSLIDTYYNFEHQEYLNVIGTHLT